MNSKTWTRIIALTLFAALDGCYSETDPLRLRTENRFLPQPSQGLTRHCFQTASLGRIPHQRQRR
jgi:hypothetical protein